MAKEPRATKQASESFEQLYARLEDTVARLEQGGLSLDESIALYEQGMLLARTCQDRLDAAEQKITKLREAFAPAPRSNGLPSSEGAEEYEYVDEDDGFPRESDDYP
jgi:exodeoxyribonuclease VII small subunit